MDAGVAAVLGAGVVTVGTIATGWTSWSLAKMQMKVESVRESREPRRVSYEAFSSAVDALHDHLQPWITFGRLLEQSRSTGQEGVTESSTFTSDNFKEGYVPRAIELADEVRRCGRNVIWHGPVELEPLVTSIMELSRELVSLFRVMYNLKRVADVDGRAIVAYDTSQFPEKLRELELGVRSFLLSTGAALNRDAVT